MFAEEYDSLFSDFEKGRQHYASMKYYWDAKNVIDSARREGKAAWKAERKEERKQGLSNTGIVKALKNGKLSIEEIADLFETEPAEV